MWALGASLFAAVEGYPPFEQAGVLASLTAVVADELEPSPHAGRLWPVIEALLLKDPAGRLDAAVRSRCCTGSRRPAPRHHRARPRPGA
jgi:hypothetical protein